MKSKVTTVFGIGFIVTVCLLTLSLFISTRAFAEAWLHVLESRINDRCGLAVAPPPLGYFNPTDPTLYWSESSVTPSIFSHDGCQDEAFRDFNSYDDPVRVNRSHIFCMNCQIAFTEPPRPHSDATASGFADAGRLRLGAYSEATNYPWLDQATQAQALADANFRNRFTVLPGDSGLPAGAPVILRWFFRLHGNSEASGKTFPNNTFTTANVSFYAGIIREFEVCQPDDGVIVCSRPTAARFDLGSITRADDSDPNNSSTLGETGNISNDLDWRAQNNLGQQLEEYDVSDTAVFTDLDSFMFRSFPVDSATLVSFLDFEATVGETLEIEARLSASAVIGGAPGVSAVSSLGSARNHYFGSFNNNIVDPENRGLQLAFEIPPETLNNPPVASAGQDGSVLVGDVVTLDGSASADPDDGTSPLNFWWIQKGGPAEVILTDDTTATPTFTPPLEGIYTFRLIVNDGEFDSGPDDVVITAALTSENQPPVAQCQNVTVPAALDSGGVASASIDNASFDPDGDTLSLSQSPAGPYAVGNTEVTLTVSDGALSSQCTATVTVTDSLAPAIAYPFLIIDEDTIDNGIQSIEDISFGPPHCGAGSPAVCINDDIADPGVRTLLFTRGNDVTPFSGLVLPTGYVGDEGLFRFSNPDLQESLQNGAMFTTAEFITATGAAADENNLDKVDGVVPLNEADVTDLEGKTVCAVVYDGDISVDVAAGFGNLKGATLGLTAFEVIAVGPDPDSASGSVLPPITVDLLPSSEVQEVCEGVEQ